MCQISCIYVPNLLQPFSSCIISSIEGVVNDFSIDLILDCGAVDGPIRVLSIP
jgi:hypothetical protein